MWSRGLGFWFSLVLAAGFLLFFFRGATLSGMVRAVMAADYRLALPGVLAYFVGVWVRTLRWRIIMTPLGDFPTRRLFPPVVIGFALNNLLPGKIGFLVRAHLVGEREHISKVASGTSILVAQLFDGVALVFMLALLSFFVTVAGWAKVVVVGVAAVYLGLLTLMWLMVSFPSPVRRLVERVQRRLPERWRRQLSEWTESTLWGMRVLRNPGKLLPVFLLSLMVWLLEAALFYLVALGFRLELPYHFLLIAVAIANIALIIPALPGGVGPYEYFGKQALLFFGVAESLATAYIGVVRLLLLLPITVVGLALYWFQRRPLGTTIRGGAGD